MRSVARCPPAFSPKSGLAITSAVCLPEVALRRRDRLSVDERRDFDDVIELKDDRIDLRGERIQYVHGKGFEEAGIFPRQPSI